MPGDPDSPRATGEAHQAPHLAPVARPERPVLNRLRSRLADLDYRVDAVVDHLGRSAHAALARNQTLPGLRALDGDDSARATLIRLWALQAPVTRRAADHALPKLLDPLVSAGLVCVTGDDEVRAAVDVRPYASDDGLQGWVVSDLTPGMDGRVTRVADDYVLGISPASTTLAQLATRNRVGTALDIGTGCGVQSLHLARHADTVVATDVNPRALRLAEWTFGLSEVDVELHQGDLYGPVADRRFDQVISNPPYVMAPPAAAHLTYREQSLPGDQLVREVVAGAATRLNPGGTAQVLANWAHPDDGDWAERLTTWVQDTGCDLHVVQREVLDPSEYVELWLTDAGLQGSDEFRVAYAEWLDHLATIGVAAIGMGWIFLSRTDRAAPELTVEHWPHPVQQPIGADIRHWAARSHTAHLPADALLDSRLVVAPDVVVESVGRPGAADPQRLTLQQQQGFRRTVEASTALAGVVGACDGELPLSVIINAVARLTETDTAAVTEEVLPHLRTLVRHGMLTLADAAGGAA